MTGKNIFILKCKQQIIAYTDGINALEQLKSLADKFDGKVINKRFITATKEVVDKNLVTFVLENNGYNYARKQNELRISLYLHNRSICYEGGCVYIDASQITIYQNSIDSDFYINADGRLNKELFIQAIDKTITTIRNYIVEYQRAIDFCDIYVEKVKRLNEELSALKKELPFPLYIPTTQISLPFNIYY